MASLGMDMKGYGGEIASSGKVGGDEGPFCWSTLEHFGVNGANEGRRSTSSVCLGMSVKGIASLRGTSLV
jgi:hypothetical protein